MTVVFAEIASPIGILVATSRGQGLAGLYVEHPPGMPVLPAAWRRDDRPFADVAAQLDEYFDGRRRSFDLELDLAGTPFQRAVWAALCGIPYGETRTYGDVAAALGRPSAARAVGAANGRNPVSIVVPCHRLVGSTGALTGYAGGLARKRALLDLEAGVRA